MKDSLTKNYKSASVYYLIGSLFNKGIAFLTVPIFTRILSTYDYGIVTTYNSWVAILATTLGFALHMGIRAAFTDYIEVIDDFISVTTVFTISVFSIVLFFSSMVMTYIKCEKILIVLVLTCLVHSFSSAIITDYLMYLMMKLNYKFRTSLMIFPNLISIIVSLFIIKAVFVKDLYLGRIIPTAIVNFLFALMVIFLVIKNSKVRYSREYLTYALKISMPLIIHGIALNILSQSDRTMITVLSDASQTGIYSLVYNFSMVATVITTALEGIWVPWFTKKMMSREINQINSMAKNYVNLMTYILGAFILVGPEILKILASKQYWVGIKIIPPVVLSNYAIFLYTMYVNVEHFYKKTPYITINTFIAAAVNIVLNFIFIPKYGYVAAAYTTLFSYTVSFVLHGHYAKKLEKNIYPVESFLIPVTHIIGLSLLFYVLLDKIIWRWTIMVIYIGLMIFKERKNVAVLFPEFLPKYTKH